MPGTPFPALPHDPLIPTGPSNLHLVTTSSRKLSLPRPQDLLGDALLDPAARHSVAHTALELLVSLTVNSVKAEAEIVRFSWYPSTLYRVENKCSSQDWMIKRTTFVLGELCVNANVATILWQLLLETHHLVRHHGSVLGNVQSYWHSIAF